MESHYVSMLLIQEYGEAPDSPRKLQSHPTGPDASYSTPGHKEDILINIYHLGIKHLKSPWYNKTGQPV
jgi:hypothetical protein